MKIQPHSNSDVKRSPFEQHFMDNKIIFCINEDVCWNVVQTVLMKSLFLECVFNDNGNYNHMETH